MRAGADDTLANLTMRQTQRVLQNGGVCVSVSGVPPEQRMPIFSKIAKGARLDNPVCRESLLSRPKLAVATDGQLFMSKKVYLYACSKPYDSGILDFGVLDALANLSGSAAVDLVERY
ncbi:hypothetical protein FOZ63_001536, partial [Perkinsus olseni]